VAETHSAGIASGFSFVAKSNQAGTAKATTPEAGDSMIRRIVTSFFASKQTIQSGTLISVFILMTFAASALGQGTGYWHTSGNRILDSNQSQVRIAGVNWYGFETTDFLAHGLWAQDYKTVLNTVKSLGYNVVRIPFSNQMVESNPVPTNFTQSANGQAANTALVGQTALTDLDTIISYAGSIGLRVILDNHRSEAGNSNEANGLWYTSAYPQKNWINDWVALATRYSQSKFTFNGNPTVIGVDLRNEPHLIVNGSYTGGCWSGDTEVNGSYAGCPASLTAQNWTVAAKTAGNAVLAVNPKLLIFVEGVDCYKGSCGWQGGNLEGVATDPIALSVSGQLVYSPHDYGSDIYQQSWFNSGTTAASLNAIWSKFWGFINSNGTAPVWVGEFGTGNISTDVQSSVAGSQGQWFQSLISYLKSNSGISWTYWALNGEDSDGLLDSNYNATPANSTKQSMLASIQAALGGGGGGGGSSCKAAPPAPTGLKATAASSSSIGLIWGATTPPANCTVSSYSVFRSTVSGFTASSSNRVATALTGTTYSDAGLQASTTYYYKVEAVDAAGTSTASAQSAAATLAASGGSACHVGYSVVNQWPGGFQAAITIGNTGTTGIANWKLTWTFANGQKITQLWSGSATQSGSTVTVASVSYNGTIAAGTSINGIGFTGTWNNATNAVPQSFAVNGTTCK
jgi:endoglucanase